MAVEAWWMRPSGGETKKPTAANQGGQALAGASAETNEKARRA